MNHFNSEGSESGRNLGEGVGSVARRARAVRRAVPPEWNRLTENVIGAAIEVHRHLGPGLLESLYEQAMAIELRRRGLVCVRQQAVRMDYKGESIGDLRADLIVESLVVVELKVIDNVLPVHLAQLMSYLRALDMPLGLLINFAHERVIDGVSRRINDRCSRMHTLPVASPSTPAFSETSELNALPEKTS